MDDTDALMRRAQEVEAEGKRRFGEETWPVYVDAISKVLPRGTNPADVVKAVIASSDDPAGSFAEAGTQSLLAMASGPRWPGDIPEALDNPRTRREADAALAAIKKARLEKRGRR